MILVIEQRKAAEKGKPRASGDDPVPGWFRDQAFG